MSYTWSGGTQFQPNGTLNIATARPSADISSFYPEPDKINAAVNSACNGVAPDVNISIVGWISSLPPPGTNGDDEGWATQNSRYGFFALGPFSNSDADFETSLRELYLSACHEIGHELNLSTSFKNDPSPAVKVHDKGPFPTDSNGVKWLGLMNLNGEGAAVLNTEWLRSDDWRAANTNASSR